MKIGSFILFERENTRYITKTEFYSELQHLEDTFNKYIRRDNITVARAARAEQNEPMTPEQMDYFADEIAKATGQDKSKISAALMIAGSPLGKQLIKRFIGVKL